MSAPHGSVAVKKKSSQDEIVVKSSQIRSSVGCLGLALEMRLGAQTSRGSLE